MVKDSSQAAFLNQTSLESLNFDYNSTPYF